jgi:high-affinity iron transporter
MGASFVIALREGIEAALIVSILLAYLAQIGRSDRASVVWWGTGVAVALSIALGTVIFAVGAEFEGRAEEVFEGVVTMLAVGVLTWMIFWMRRQGARIKSELQEKVDTALVSGGFALAALAFFAVLREGVETALFIYAAAQGTAVETGGVGAQLLGAILGLAIAVALGVAIYRGGVRMNLRTFFRFTGLALVVVAAGLFAYSLHERGLIGYNADPTWLEVVGWLGYLLVVGGLYLRPATVPVPRREPTTATTVAVASDETARPDRR